MSGKVTSTIEKELKRQNSLIADLKEQIRELERRQKKLKEEMKKW